jgi:3-oxoacyl-[acyl-carrier-protein] synthase II
MAPRPPIGIVGAGCRFPGSEGPEGLWQTLRQGRDEVGEAPPYRARTLAATAAEVRLAPGRRGAIDGAERFDWRAFRMSPKEARCTDPQHRLLLETAWEALEDAGIAFERLAGTRTAVFMGAMWPDYAKLLAENPAQLTGYATAGAGLALAANRISHFFDLRGPSVSLDVQCASSLVAVHLAAASIWSGEATLALAGGVNLILAGDSDLMMSRAGVISPSGRCRTFDAAADGFVRGEGVGVVVLKPLELALADGDRVLATVRGTACNHDGRRAPLTAPSQESQVELVRAACASAGVEPADLDYVELHGTGTPRGDPVEAAALGEAVAGRPPGDPCLVGSVKTNIGHCESAAGVASLIKVALALHHGTIPATINHATPHPAIDGERLGLELVSESRPWPARERRWLAGISGLSLGGGNAHVVLEQAPAAPAVTAGRTRPPGPLALPVSARSRGSLRRLALAYAEQLEGVGEDAAALRAICAAAALRRTHHEHRIAAAGGSAGELSDGLRRLVGGLGDPATALPRRVAQPIREPWQMFPGLDSDSSTAAVASVLYRAGRPVRWAALYGTHCAAVPLPAYRWERERLWIDPAGARGEGDPPSDFAALPGGSQNERR